MVDAGRQKKAVFAVRPLLIRGIAPRLQWAGDEMDRVFDAGNAAALLDRLARSLKSPALFARSDDTLVLCVCFAASGVAVLRQLEMAEIAQEATGRASFQACTVRA